MGYPPICNPPLYSAVTFEGDLLMEVDSIYVIELPMDFFFILLGWLDILFIVIVLSFILFQKKVQYQFFLMIFFFKCRPT